MDQTTKEKHVMVQKQHIKTLKQHEQTQKKQESKGKVWIIAKIHISSSWHLQ